VSDLTPRSEHSAPTAGGPSSAAPASSSDLGDILERVLDKGIVIVGDIRVNLLDIELLTIKLRLLVASVDTARRIGIRWWETDPWLVGGEHDQGSSALRERVERMERELDLPDAGRKELEAGNSDHDDSALQKRIARLERELKRATASEQRDDE
jgi:hypothetical protein